MIVNDGRWDNGRVCRDCKRHKPLSEYYLRKSGNPYTLCIPCYNDDHKERVKRRPKLAAGDRRVCKVCNRDKDITEFTKNSNMPGGFLFECKSCYAKKYRVAKWGLDASEHPNCDSCGDEFGAEDIRNVDHDHRCCPPGTKNCGECIRGVLCTGCNIGLGAFQDNPERLLAAAEYLNRFGVKPGTE